MRLLPFIFTLLLALLVTNSAALAAPATVDTSTAATATTSSSQRKTFFDSLNNTHWAFYYNGAAIEYSYSADGVAWTSAGTLAYNTASFSVIYKTIGGVSYAFVVAEANTYDVVVRRGALGATSIAFEAEQTVFNGTSLSDNYKKPTVAISENNHLWLSAIKDRGAIVDRFQVNVRRSTNAADGNIALFNTAVTVGRGVKTLRDAVIMPQNGDGMYLISSTDGTAIVGYIFDGVDWSAANEGGDYSWFGFEGSGVDEQVNAIAISGSDIYVGGVFNSAGEVVGTSRVARWDGTNWHALGSGLNNFVQAIAVNGTDVYVGGSFTDAGGLADADRIARWDGASWHALGTGLGSTVRAIAMSGTDVYVGGDFLDAGGLAAGDRIARWDGASWNAVGAAGLGNSVSAIAVDGSNVYVGGSFLDAGGIGAADRIVRWDGSNWNAMGSGISTGGVSAIAISGSNVFVGGSFTGAGGVGSTARIARWNGAAWSAVGTGISNGTVRAIAVSGNLLYLGGTFVDGAGNANADRIIYRDLVGNTWNALGTGIANNYISALATSGSDLYAGGWINNVGGVSGTDYFARWNGTDWNTLETGGFSHAVHAIVIDGSDVYVGGQFFNIGGVSGASGIARWDGSNWNALGAGLDSVHVIVVNGSDIYAGGYFPGGVAKWDGANWNVLGAGVDNGVFAIGVHGTDIYVGGNFAEAGGVVGTASIARWDGASWNILGAGLSNGGVDAIAISNSGDVYVGGWFTDAGGTADADGIAIWDGSDWSGLGGGLNSSVAAVAIGDDGIYVGGYFTDVGGDTAADYLVRWNGSSWSKLGSGVNGAVIDIAIRGGELFALGGFTDAGGTVGASTVARWDGTSWHALDFGLNAQISISVIAVSGDNIHVGGAKMYASGSDKLTSYLYFAPAIAIDADTTTEISATSDSDGNLYLSYTNEDDEVRFRRFDDSDASWGDTVTLDTTASSSPTVSYRSANGGVTASWVKTNALTYSHALSPFGDADWSSDRTFYNTGTNASIIVAARQETDDLQLFWTNGAANPYSIFTDSLDMMTVPTVAISSGASSPTNDSPIPVTVTFSEDVTGFVVGDITVGNGSAGNFVAVDAETYTADVTPTANGAVTVNIAGSVAIDDFGNNNTAATQFSISFDSAAPTVALSSSATDPTNSSPFSVTVQFNETVTGFVVGDITVGNGTAGNFVAVDGDTYTADITPTADGAVTVDVAAAVAEDAAENDNTAAIQLSRVYDNTIPTLSMVAPGVGIVQANAASFSLSGACSENGRAVSLSATSSAGGAAVVAAPNCNAGAWNASLDVSGLSDGTVTVTANHEDAVGLDAVQASRAVSKEASVPSVSISSSLTSPTEEATIPILVQFSEAVTGFVAADISVVNATLSGFTAVSALQYRANLTPAAAGAVRVNVAAGVAADSVGNVNSAAAQFSIVYQVAESEIEIDTVCSVWNSFFNKADGAVWNILEHVNSGTETLAIETTLYSRDGVAQSTARFVIPPEQRQLDLLVHDMEGWAANSYGLVCSKVTSGASSDLDGRMVYYRQKQAGGFEYIFASPFSRGNLGRQFVGFNTYQPSLNSKDRANFVANWIQITNLEDDTQSGELRFYNQAGVLLKSERLTVPGIGQSDISAHEWEVPMVGLVEWRPVDEQARFIVRNTRYLYDNAEMQERFDGVIQVAASDGSKEMLSAMLDTQDASAVLELANITGSDVQSEVRLYDAEGELLADLDFTLAAHSTQHVIADSILSNSTGSVTVAVQDSEVKSLIATVIQYGREPSGSISYLYGTTALRPVSDVLRSSYNTFLGQGCELHLLNQSETEQTATVAMQRNNGTQVFGSSTLTLRPMQSVVSNICVAESEQAYGVVTLTTDHGAAFQPFLLRTDGSGGSRYPVPVR